MINRYVIIIALIFIHFSLLLFFCDKKVNNCNYKNKTEAITNLKISKYNVNIYRCKRINEKDFLKRWNNYKIDISQDDKIIYSDGLQDSSIKDNCPETCESCFKININDKKETSFLPLYGEDITGDGIPNLVIERENCEGNSCKYNYTIFSLGDKFEIIKNFEAKNYDCKLKFVDLSRDKIYEIIVEDHYGNFNITKKLIVKSYVVLRYDKGKYIPVADYMKKNAPNDDDKIKIIGKIKSELYNKNKDSISASEINKWYNINSSQDMWQYLIDLIFSGNGNIAREIFNKVIIFKGENITNLKNKVWDDFITDVSTNIYWEDIKKMNNW